MTSYQIQQRITELRAQPWKYWINEAVMGFVALFVIDVVWRFIDWIIDDGIIAHLPWLKFLGSD